MGYYQWEYDESCRQVREVTNNLVSGLEQVPFLYPYPTQGNFVLCWILYGFTGQALARHLFEDQRIHLMPGVDRDDLMAFALNNRCS